MLIGKIIIETDVKILQRNCFYWVELEVIKIYLVIAIGIILLTTHSFEIYVAIA